MKNHYISLELAKRMKELGFEQESEKYWKKNIGQSGHNIVSGLNKPIKKMYNEVYSAFSVGELGLILPDLVYSMRRGNGDFICAEGILDYYADFMNYRPHNYPNQIATTEAEARGLMLCYLKENGYL